MTECQASTSPKYKSHDGKKYINIVNNKNNGDENSGIDRKTNGQIAKTEIFFNNLPLHCSLDITTGLRRGG